MKYGLSLDQKLPQKWQSQQTLQFVGIAISSSKELEMIMLQTFQLESPANLEIQAKIPGDFT